ncbi:STAS domain-containing protein [Cyanobacteria bacterium FACHB-472]|nr:STAS domain-containing protein [Cyanobacteria bacterium FACHB-472]
MSILSKVVQSPDVLDGSKATQFTRDIEILIKQGVKIVLLDLRNVTFMSSSGLMALVSVLRMARDSGCKAFIHSSSAQVRIILEMTGLDQVVQILNNSEDFNNLEAKPVSNVQPKLDTLPRSVSSRKLKSAGSQAQAASAR